MRIHHLLFAVLSPILLLLNMSCGGGSGAPAPPAPPAIGVTLSASSLTLFPDGATASVDVTVSRPSGLTGSVTLQTSILPPGITAQVESPGSGNTGKVTFSAMPQQGGSGTHPVVIRANSGSSNGSANLSLAVGITASIGASVTRRIDLFMSTSFQPASWTDRFFINHPEATIPLDELNPQHINVQVLERDIPQLTAATFNSAGRWDFNFIDGILNPVFTAGDHSPLYQIAMGPTFMYNLSNPQMGLRDGTYQEFADYCVRLVKYYNKDGFIDADGHLHVSQYAQTWPITYWGIYNEPNINGFTAQQYVDMYNAVVPQMLSEDPTLKFVAVELADFGNEPQRYLPTFVNQVTAPVDVVATHYYSSCNQRDADQMLLDTVPDFASRVSYIYSQLQSKPALANVPVWVTENNVNADWDRGGGISNCNAPQPFVTDQRGSSAFFAGWRPYVFSRLAQANARALHHWGFHADRQYGEVDGGTAQKFLSYWVDYWLGRYFPSPPGSDVLQFTASDTATVEILPTIRDDGTIVIMIANHAVASSTDNNAAGAPRTVRLNLSALWPLTWATQLTIDARTNTATGPVPMEITPAEQMEITLPGYGVTFLEMK
jgi:hypothetical protein